MLLQTDMAGCVCKTKIGGCASKEYYWTNELDCRICAEIIRRPKNIQKLNVAIVETTMAQKYDEEIQTIFTNNVGNLYWDPVDFESIADCQMENAVVRELEDISETMSDVEDTDVAVIPLDVDELTDEGVIDDAEMFENRQIPSDITGTYI
ncbi:hypothetical protein QE152_g25178 [Popillia japonica]|uniref:Uncharacterized protein n=1 Tax=Popillia japonica TaxID=7064 RepID=A0AAW1K114_POPJA